MELWLPSAAAAAPMCPREAAHRPERTRRRAPGFVRMGKEIEAPTPIDLADKVGREADAEASGAALAAGFNKLAHASGWKRPDTSLLVLLVSFHERAADAGILALVLTGSRCDARPHPGRGEIQKKAVVGPAGLEPATRPL